MNKPFKFTNSVSPQELQQEVDRIFKTGDIKTRDGFMSELKTFIQKNKNYYWFTLLVFYRSQELYYESQNDELEIFHLGFQINDKEFDFHPKASFTLFYNKESTSSNYWESSKDYKWTKNKDDEDEYPFIGLILNETKISLADFSEKNDTYNEFRNAATSYLWFSLQNFTISRPRPDAEELATLLWSVFDSEAHDYEEFKADGNVGQDALDNILHYVLHIDKEKYNTEENPDDRDDLQNYRDYVHDYVKIAEEILDMDIFDM